jgi:predicted DNA binding CopG/RHH family protein
MLQAMQQSAEPAPSSNSSSFAGLLAAFAAPNQLRAKDWCDDGLADDYETLSYERALRTHTRYRSAEDFASTIDSSFTKPPDPELIRIREAFPATSDAKAESPASDLLQVNAAGLPAAPDRNLKSASITIRLSEAESAQLRRRAAEAGLTVSAYLRSCTFEAESLRAMVKDTLAQLRGDPSKADGSASKRTAANDAASRPIRRSWRQWWARFMPRAHAAQGVARA